MFSRLLKDPGHSFFLFGPRGVGKTTWIAQTLPKSKTWTLDLLDRENEIRYTNNPRAFAQVLAGLAPDIEWVVVDEVQKVPFILDEVHRYMNGNGPLKFCLTGSSARKLKRGKANLLAGRAFSMTMGPLTSVELGADFDLESILAFGSLPSAILFSVPQKTRYLRTYTHTYLKEEIQVEGAVRKLPSFTKFLELAAHENGNILNFSNLSREIGIDIKTCQSYFQILEDTLLGFYIPAWTKSVRKQQLSHPKFYLFDTGVTRALTQQLSLPILPKTTEYGRAFEQFWVTELMRMNDYRETDFRFYYLATHSMEIDLVIERPGKPVLFIEFKSSEFIQIRDIKPLISIVKDVDGSQGICLCKEPQKRIVDGVLICPWQEALQEIFGMA